MSADIILFIPRRNRKNSFNDLSASASPPEDLVMDHADTAPCEHVWPEECDPASPENVNA